MNQKAAFAATPPHRDSEDCARNKAEKKKKLFRYPWISPGPCAALYLLFVLFAWFFTQALISSLSSVLMIFALIFPVLLFLHAWSGAVFLRFSVHADAETVQKEVPVGYEIRIVNHGFLPYPFLDADMDLPDWNGVRCKTQRMLFGLMPFASCSIRRQTVFHYRGNYAIGLREIYCYDFLRLFRIRLRVGRPISVFVMPRRLLLPFPQGSTSSDSDTTDVFRLQGFDCTEMTDIREYRQGDSLRDIHWKLSSKTQNLLVRHYGMHACRTILFIADLGMRYEDPGHRGLYEEDINPYCADAVTERTLGMLYSAVHQENSVCMLLWYDRRADGGTRKEAAVSETLYGEEDYERIYPYFATAEMHDAALYPETLCAGVPFAENTSCYIMTSRLDDGMLRRIQAYMGNMSSVPGGHALTVSCFDPVKKVRDPEEKRRLEEEQAQMCERLRSSGITVDVFVSAEQGE